jgi:tetratricopeptide (TPR) repeat protein
VQDPDSKEKAFGTMLFRVVTTEGSPAVWDIVDPELTESEKTGVLDYQRAQCYLSQGNSVEGATWLQAAFQRNPTNEDVRSKLVDSYFSRSEFNQIATLFQKSGLTANTDDQTILRIAESFDKIGQIAQSIQVLESAINLKPQSGPLYLSLANYYQRSGNETKANEMQQKGRSLIGEKAQAGS